jgi:hypothetical protein
MSTEQDQAIIEARKKFGELYGNTKLGGKGIFKLTQEPKKRRNWYPTEAVQSRIKKSHP